MSIQWLYNESGVRSVYQTGPNAWLLIASRSSRMFAFGATSLILALYFSALGFSDFQIGLFMTLTLIGDVILSLFLTLIADRFGRRRILLVGAALMVSSAAVFVFSESFWVLLGAAVLGIISATGGDFGPFRAIEESTLCHLTTPEMRSDVLSWYVAASALGSAAGTEFSGHLIDWLQELSGWTVVDAYRAIFWLYIVMGITNVVLVFSLSQRCEASATPPEYEPAQILLDDRRQKDQATGEDIDEDISGLNSGTTPAKSQRKSRFAQISLETRSIMYKLWFLLAMDSLADGMVPYALTNYYMERKFVLSKSTLANITSVSFFLSSFSTLLAGPLARHLGLIKTMVFTHLPSSVAVLLFPFAPNVPMTALLFFVRTGLNPMDQAPRAAFIAAVVRPEERTVVLGVTSTIRTLASTVGPGLTGLLAGNHEFWIAFVTAGALRVAYDLGLFGMFVNMKLHTHEVVESGDEEETAGRS